MNIVFWSIIFFFVGAFWQIIDSILGVKVFRIWYNLTHKEPLMPEIRRGFITKRGSKANAFWAFIGSLVLCLLFVFQGDAGSLTKMMLWFLGIPVIMIGFYFGGPGLEKMWKITSNKNGKKWGLKSPLKMSRPTYSLEKLLKKGNSRPWPCMHGFRRRTIPPFPHAIPRKFQQRRTGTLVKIILHGKTISWINPWIKCPLSLILMRGRPL